MLVMAFECARATVCTHAPCARSHTYRQAGRPAQARPCQQCCASVLCGPQLAAMLHTGGTSTNCLGVCVCVCVPVPASLHACVLPAIRHPGLCGTALQCCRHNHAGKKAFIMLLYAVGHNRGCCPAMPCCQPVRCYLESACPVPTEQVLPHQQQAVHAMLVAVCSGGVEDGLQQHTVSMAANTPCDGKNACTCLLMSIFARPTEFWGCP